MCVHQKENGTTTFVCCHLVVAKRPCRDLEEKHHQLHISHNERSLNTDNKKHFFFVTLKSTLSLRVSQAYLTNLSK
jgi:hypothetical protein